MINQREELSTVVNDESGYYDKTKLQRINWITFWFLCWQRAQINANSLLLSVYWKKSS